jgi:hypothetical protein
MALKLQAHFLSFVSALGVSFFFLFSPRWYSCCYQWDCFYPLPLLPPLPYMTGPCFDFGFSLMKIDMVGLGTCVKNDAPNTL